MQIAGVPESVTREQFVALIDAFGVDAENLREMTLDPSGVHAVVYARDDKGRYMTTPTGDPATHNVFVRVQDVT